MLIVSFGCGAFYLFVYIYFYAAKNVDIVLIALENMEALVYFSLII